jgi:hypothetical protein
MATVMLMSVLIATNVSVIRGDGHTVEVPVTGRVPVAVTRGPGDDGQKSALFKGLKPGAVNIGPAAPGGRFLYTTSLWGAKP